MRCRLIDVVEVVRVLCCCCWLDASYVVAFDVFEQVGELVDLCRQCCFERRAEAPDEGYSDFSIPWRAQRESPGVVGITGPGGWPRTVGPRH